MIELSNVGLHRGGAQILDGVSMRIEASQVVLLSGPSGIGKTSLLSLLSGFVIADSGEVRVFQHEVSRLRATSTALLRRKLAFVPQELELVDTMSILANVCLALEVCGVKRREAKKRAIEVLQAVFELPVDVAANDDFLQRNVSELSTGQRRRVSLARGMIRNAEIFVADEPSNDLDASRVLLLVDLIETMRSSGTAVVMATNDPRLLIHAQQPDWRHLALVSQKLVPGDMAALFRGAAEQRAGDTVASNIVPFPASKVGRKG